MNQLPPQTAYACVDINLKLVKANDYMLDLFFSNGGWHNKPLPDRWIDVVYDNGDYPINKKVFHRWVRKIFTIDQGEFNLIVRAGSPTPRQYYVRIYPDPENNTLKHILLLPAGSIEHTLEAKFKKNLRLEYSIARKIQKNINNYIMEMIEGRFFKYRFERIFKPATILSGDLINIKQVNRRYTSFFLGDGKGHGLPAAMFSTLIHSYLNILASKIIQGDPDTGKLFSQINTQAQKDFQDSGEHYFFSGIYALLDGNTREIRLVNGGHPPGILIREGKVALIESSGPLVGVIRDAEYCEKIFELKDKDCIITYTDGLYELLPDQEKPEVQIKNLFEMFIGNGIEPEVLREHLEKWIIQSGQKTRVEDDISVLVMNVEEKNGG